MLRLSKPGARCFGNPLRVEQHVDGRAFIEARQPAVCITGHIHESPGVDRIGRTTVVNAGAFRDGGFVVIEAGPCGFEVALRRVVAAR